MNVPKLRFKEFTNDYKKYKYKDVLKIKSGRDQKQIMCNDGKYPILGTGGVIGKTNNFLYNKPSVLIGRKGTIDKPQYMEIPFWTVDTLFYSEIFSNNFPKYIYYSFQNINWKKYDESTGVPSLSCSTIENIDCLIPSIEEQTKIANFLSLLDKKIELQTKKIEDLKLYKLCLKNRVFNESDMLRDKLNNLCHCKVSNINLSDIEFDNGKFPIYGATGEIKKISTFQFSKNYIAIVKDGASVGKTIICDSNSSIIATMNAIIPNKLPIYYFNELIENINFSKYIVGSGIPHIYFKDYSLEIVKIHSRPRMKLIDSIFNDLLKKIVYEEDKLKKLLQLKKGLMQNMFV